MTVRSTTTPQTAARQDSPLLPFSIARSAQSLRACLPTESDLIILLSAVRCCLCIVGSTGANNCSCHLSLSLRINDGISTNRSP